MQPTVSVHVHHELPMARLEHLVDASVQEGLRFLRRMRDEWSSGEVRFDGARDAFFVAEAEGRAVGVCGLTIDPHSGSGEIGRIRKLYVDRAFRRCGIGRRLVGRLLAVAAPHFRELRVRTRGGAAIAFYASLGFSPAPEGESYTHYLLMADSPHEVADARYADCDRWHSDGVVSDNRRG